MPPWSGSPPTLSEPRPRPCDVGTSQVRPRTGRVLNGGGRGTFVSLLAPWTQRRLTGARSPAPRRGPSPQGCLWGLAPGIVTTQGGPRGHGCFTANLVLFLTAAQKPNSPRV